MEGQSIGKLHYTNCNLLHASNTQNLKETIPKILPELRTSTKTTLDRFQHQQPSYLNVACLPFAQNYFSLEKYAELNTHASTPHYASAFQDVEEERTKAEIGKKMVAMAQRDWANRRQIIDSKPVYGSDLRRSVKVNLLLDDLQETKRHKYVTRHSKEKESSMKECFGIASAVFNSFAAEKADTGIIEYECDGTS